MAQKRISENPSIADQVLLTFKTPDSSGCLQNPYQLDSFNIHYIEKDFSNNKYAYVEFTNPDIVEEIEAAKNTACLYPTEENIAALERVQKRSELAEKETLYYNNANVFLSVGTPDNPAYLSTDPNSILSFETDENNNALTGILKFLWNPLGAREGNYLVTYTYKLTPLGDTMSNGYFFSLGGSTQLTTSIPTHFTKKGKYETLQERYMPEMFKMNMCANDLSPDTISELNKSVAAGFTIVEDLANQLIDIADANATHESNLNLLASGYGVKLKSADPTLWRRQIRRAVPVYKKKGTLGGLVEAFAQSGMQLIKFVKMWQVISPSTFQEHINVEEDAQTDFVTTKEIYGPLDSNFEVYFRAKSDEDVQTNEIWQKLTPYTDHVTFNPGTNELTWIGNTLNAGDSIRVVYKIAPVADQTKEDYIRALDLADLRDERDQDYPVKNWNVRVIAEDDPMFNEIIDEKTPFVDYLVFGKVRTEFPYSENIYNMEEYNGSKRDSKNPCDIDKDFMDPCSKGLSSKYVIDLEIDELSNNRLLEAVDVLKENMPLHAVLHSMNIWGRQQDFIPAPIESIYALVKCNGTETTVADPPQTIFYRKMLPEQQEEFKRNTMASMEQVYSEANGVLANERVVLYTPYVQLEQVPIDQNPSLVKLEIYDGSNVGVYVISDIDGSVATVAGVTEPVNQSEFTFRLSNEVLYKPNSVIITTETVYSIKDSASVQYMMYGIDTSCTVKIGSTHYNIAEVTSDNTLLLSTGPGSSATVSYEVYNGSTLLYSSTRGIYENKSFGLVSMPNPVQYRGGASESYSDLGQYIKTGHYFSTGSNEYRICEVTGTHSFKIENCSSGYSGAGRVYHRVLDQESGYFHYDGMVLESTDGNLESTLGIVSGDGSADDDLFKNSFLVYIGSIDSPSGGSGSYYAIAEISGSTLKLSGPALDLGTSGVTTAFTVNRFIKTKNLYFAERKDTIPVLDIYGKNIGEEVLVYVPEYEFESIDRRGNEVISNTQESVSSMLLFMDGPKAEKILNSPDNSEVQDSVIQAENISFKVESK